MKSYLGIELGSTRIKAVLIDQKSHVIASGSYTWSDSYENGYWTYHMEDVWKGLQEAIADLRANLSEEVEVVSMGVSAMMHGYLPFDSEGKLLSGFRTWRNTTTGEAAERLSELFAFNIPQRWSISHLYQAILNKEEHVKDIDYLTTLAGYVHWQLTGRKILGIGEASGMFPVNSETRKYNASMAEKFNVILKEEGLTYQLEDILPEIVTADKEGGCLSEEGVALLKAEGFLKAGTAVCPPEGDAGTGMVATNSVREKTGNVSAGTSIFSMAVLEKELNGYYEEIDMVTTPAGKPVAMVHCNTCTSDLNSWIDLFEEVCHLYGAKPSRDELYQKFFEAALEGEKDCGGLVSVNYYSGEPVTHVADGRPLFVRRPDTKVTLNNFARSILHATIATLVSGMRILSEKEGVELDKIYGHGGLFKTKGVAQRILAGALRTPVAVMETAGEGGPWGMAILAQYNAEHAGLSLEDYLEQKVFSENEELIENPEEADAAGFERYLKEFENVLEIERKAVEVLK